MPHLELHRASKSRGIQTWLTVGANHDLDDTFRHAGQGKVDAWFIDRAGEIYIRYVLSIFMAANNLK
jgi:hypothetical protein